jgi:hypothetical protein
LKIPHQAWINPPDIHLVLSLQPPNSNSRRITDRLPRNVALLHWRVV